MSTYVIEQNIPKLGTIQVNIDIILRPRSKKLMDIDNCIKPILDAVQDAGVIDDDVQVARVSIERGLIQKGGGCVVMIIPTSQDVNLAPIS